ncbi:hypothetical protein D9M71_697030 [compost metagenome]
MIRSVGSQRAVSIRIGMADSARSQRHSDRPSSPGSIRSSTTTSKCSACNARRIAAPSVTPLA